MIKKHQNFWIMQLFYVVFVVICLLASWKIYGKITLHEKWVINLPASMIWNVFLSLLAFDFAYWAIKLKNRAFVIVLSLLWLIFYPNTFYILTDNIHFAGWFETLNLTDSSVVINFNILSISVIWGSVLGAWSILMMIERFLTKKIWKILIVIILSFLSSIGIFVGRSLEIRLNSWDLLTHPIYSLTKIFGSLTPENFAFFASFTLAQLFLIALFWLVRYNQRKGLQNEENA